MELLTRKQMNKQIKLVVFLVILFIAFNYGPSVYAKWNILSVSSSISNSIIDSGQETIESSVSGIRRKVEKESERESLQTYPETKKERHDWILDYLSWNHPELKNEEINNLMLILEKENGSFEPNRISTNHVYHCRRQDNNQNYSATGGCRDRDTQLRVEQDGRGVSQILKSTWELSGYKCKGDPMEIKAQLDCTANIFRVSGYSAWTTSARKLNLIR